MTKMTFQQRFGVALAVGAAGGIVALAITQAGGAMFRDWGFLRVATAGAFLAGLLVAPGFGGAGVRRWFVSGVSFGTATILGAIFAVMLMPLEEILTSSRWLRVVSEMAGSSLFGPVYVIGMIGDNLRVLAGWIGALTAIQVLALTQRR